jgi:hypothetical protein
VALTKNKLNNESHFAAVVSVSFRHSPGGGQSPPGRSDGPPGKVDEKIFMQALPDKAPRGDALGPPESPRSPPGVTTLNETLAVVGRLYCGLLMVDDLSVLQPLLPVHFHMLS